MRFQGGRRAGNSHLRGRQPRRKGAHDSRILLRHFGSRRVTTGRLVLRDANAAMRRHNGTELQGDWLPIVDRSKHDRGVALLSSPERRSHTGPRPGARKHLLTHGIGRCGKCGGLLRVGNRARSQGVIYMGQEHGCTGRVQSRVDDLVARVVIGRLQMPDALDWRWETTRRLVDGSDAARLLAPLLGREVLPGNLSPPGEVARFPRSASQGLCPGPARSAASGPLRASARTPE